MNADQKVVAIGSSSGVVLMVLSVWLLTRSLPSPHMDDALAGRIAYTLVAEVVALIPLLLMIITIANGRFASEAIDPTRHAESKAMEINGRVTENTLQQTVLFTITLLAMSTIVPMHQLQAVWACTIVFVTARMVFWIGYRIAPLYRAPGMSATVYMNLCLMIYVLWHAFAGK